MKSLVMWAVGRELTRRPWRLSIKNKSLLMRLIILFSAAILFSNKFSTQTYQYYFGNLHAHTAFSDGNKDSTSSGIARPDEGYAYAKLSNDFDFLGISE